MFALWPGDQLNFSIFIKPAFGFTGQPAASEAGHIANANVVANCFRTYETTIDDNICNPRWTILRTARGES